MSRETVRVRELAGWGLDANEYRPSEFDASRLADARRRVSLRVPFESSCACLEEESIALQDSLLPHASRADLHAEMEGLEWSLGVVDLRFLLAFQRRLAFPSEFSAVPVPAKQDWAGFIDLAFGAARSAVYDLLRDTATNTLVLRSDNPNLHFRLSDDASSPVVLHAGSPFFEVAQYRGRWFLRDGYHRAYALLRAGVSVMPAVIVQAKTVEELGAARPWFFSEEILFSAAPPRVVDFLDDALTIEYERPPLIRTLRVTIEETLAPATIKGESI